MIKISVIVCTHNPRRDYLERTLESLRGQSVPLDEWELLLVDNRSDQPLSDSGLVDWHPNGRTVREEGLGLTRARIRGIRETAGGLVVFSDDDNVLDFDYLESILRLAERYPDIGVFGAGTILPEFEVQPAAECVPYTPMLALRKQASSVWSNNPCDGVTPWGAGLVARRLVCDEYADCAERDQSRVQLGRTGTRLLSGEDDEFSWVACRLNLGKGLFHELKLTHLIDKRRVDPGYLVRIAEGHAFSHRLLRFIHRDERRNYGDELLRSPQPQKGVVDRIVSRIKRHAGPLGSLLGRSFPERIEAAKRRGDREAEKFLAKNSRSDSQK